MWILWAVLAAISAALVIVLTKAGLKNVDSSLAFAIQAVLILLITWGVVIYQGNVGDWKGIEKNDWIFLLAAGVFTSLSTLFSYKALSMGPASYVATIERSSLIFAIILSIFFLKEKITWQIVVGGIAIIGGAMLIALSDPGE
ncbi:transporter family protein [Pedobacter psychrotolerans]|uniref:Membrane protein n=1 Tax=Pedobacter psychrotolerans TaxID=1843235 RepID=A0A4R2H7V2_9SPHI|nr:EamA family transporter [Pedobacter psychrotolerans]TCO21444.1 transporter family protein [Pedobacter psychrotolerans]GGE38701.1 membrane protein [Pedobacter psychrotolerans]